jgi:hypothetical protein
MDKRMQKIILAMTLVLFIGVVQAPSLNIAPSNMDLGEVQRGETYEYNIYINPRNTGGPVKVTPQLQGPFFSTLFNSSEVNEDRVSQEDIAPWIEFQEDSIVADPDNRQSYRTREGNSVTAAAVIPVEIRVPNDAEPGYHAAKIGFGASGVDGGSGFSTSTWVLPYIEVEMDVPGNAEREIEMDDPNFLRIGEDEAQIIVPLRNTGTVTTEFEGGTVDILNTDGEKVGEVDLSSTVLEPDELQPVEATWESDRLEPGTYELSGTGDYITGRFFIGGQGSIEQAIRDRVEIEDPSGESTESESDVPIWLVMMILILLGIIMYSFDIDPLWIALIVGVLAITAFVLMTDLPLYLIGITLILGFVMIYYGVI